MPVEVVAALLQGIIDPELRTRRLTRRGIQADMSFDTKPLSGLLVCKHGVVPYFQPSQRILAKSLWWWSPGCR